MTTRHHSLALGVMLAAAVISAQERPPRSLGADRLPKGFTIEVVKRQDGDRLRISNSEHGRAYTIPVPATEIVETVFTEDRSRLIIIGKINHANSIDVVDFASGKAVASTVGREPAVSPAGDYVAFKESYRRDMPSQPAIYRILETSAGKLLGSNSVVYPTDDKLHSDQSEMSWIGNVLIFLDHVAGKTGVVAVELSIERAISRVVRQDLPTDELIDSSVLDPGADAARFIVGPQVRQVPGEGLNIRLVFPERVGLKVKRVDLRVW